MIVTYPSIYHAKTLWENTVTFIVITHFLLDLVSRIYARTVQLCNFPPCLFVFVFICNSWDFFQVLTNMWKKLHPWTLYVPQNLGYLVSVYIQSPVTIFTRSHHIFKARIQFFLKYHFFFQTQDSLELKVVLCVYHYFHYDYPWQAGFYLSPLFTENSKGEEIPSALCVWENSSLQTAHFSTQGTWVRYMHTFVADF